MTRLLLIVMLALSANGCTGRFWTPEGRGLHEVAPPTPEPWWERGTGDMPIDDKCILDLSHSDYRRRK